MALAQGYAEFAMRNIGLEYAGAEKSWLRSALWYRCRVAGYQRPLSRGELRQIRRERRRVVFWTALVILLAIAGVVGLIYLLNVFPHL